jgi:AcrR family transcriptional regulator
VDKTRQAILAATRDLVATTGSLSLKAVADKAGVSRITVYNQFRSKADLINTLVPRLESPSFSPEAKPREQLTQRIFASCHHWAADPALFRHVSTAAAGDAELDRELAERLAAADELRPGCSIKEAEDVIGALTSFAVFDRLHKDGRRSPLAVAEILMRLVSGILT